MSQFINLKDKVFPTIVVNHPILLPHNDIHIIIDNQVDCITIEASQLSDNYVLFINQKDNHQGKLESELMSIGVLGKIIMKRKQLNGNYKIKVKTFIRVLVLELIKNETYTCSRVSTIPIDSLDQQKNDHLLEMIKKTVIEDGLMYFPYPKEIITRIHIIDELDILIDYLSYQIKTDDYDKLKYVYITDVCKRVELLLLDIEVKMKKDYDQAFDRLLTVNEHQLCFSQKCRD